MQLRHKLFLFVLMIFAIGTNVSAQDTTAPKSKRVIDSSKFATIYVYRMKSPKGSLIEYNLHLDDQFLCRVRNNATYAIRVYKEGPAEIWARTEQRMSFPINIQYGKSYYVRCSAAMGILVGQPDIHLVYPMQGQTEYEILEEKNRKG